MADLISERSHRCWPRCKEVLSVSASSDGVFTTVPELTAAIEDYVAHHNENPKPFIWTAKARDILQKVVRANRRLSSKQNEALH